MSKYQRAGMDMNGPRTSAARRGGISFNGGNWPDVCAI
jgi:hypothetical protein